MCWFKFCSLKTSSLWNDRPAIYLQLRVLVSIQVCLGCDADRVDGISHRATIVVDVILSPRHLALDVASALSCRIRSAGRGAISMVDLCFHAPVPLVLSCLLLGKFFLLSVNCDYFVIFEGLLIKALKAPQMDPNRFLLHYFEYLLSRLILSLCSGTHATFRASVC